MYTRTLRDVNKEAIFGVGIEYGTKDSTLS